MSVTAMAPPSLVVPASRVPLPFGLFSTFTFRPNADRWESGVAWEQDALCEPADGIGFLNAVTPASTIGLPKDFSQETPGDQVATPFTVYGHFKCSPVGYSPDQAQSRANAHLVAREEARAEQALWTGDLGNVPNLRGFNMDAGSTTALAAGVAQTVSTGIALLENYIALEYGSMGVIHMSRAAALLASSGLGVLETKGARLQTKVGTPVAAGAGYPGTAPVGSPAPSAGESWAYVSPAIFGYRSDVFTSSNRPGDLLDRGQNNLYAVAERNYLLGFDPCGVGAVLLDVSP